MVTVASSTRIPTASARPPSVITLMVWPSTESAISEHSTASGIETVMIKVERQLPRKHQDHEAGQRGRDNSFANHRRDGLFDEAGLIGEHRRD